MKKVMTLCLLHDDKRILLGLKKRGFGSGRWNGFGGKVEDGESIEEAAKRELHEEAGILINSLIKRGVITFSSEEHKNDLEVHFFSSVFSGEGQESDEMLPRWFHFHEIPFENMWPDDLIWMPIFLEGKNFQGKAHFKDKDTILHHDIKPVDSIN